MAKKLLTVSIEKTLSRCVPRQNFNIDFPTVAGTPGAPKPPTKFPGNVIAVSRDIIPQMLEDVQRIYKNEGFVCMVGFIVTSMPLLLAMSVTNAIVVVQKYMPNDDTLKLYRRMKCLVRRNQLPGNIFPNLVRRDGQDDFGIIDGCRYIGNFYHTTKKLTNEARNYVHPKMLLGFMPEKKKKSGIVYVPAFGWDGSPNFSYNAENNLELVHRTQDQGYILKLFELFGYYFSLSEGLHNFAPGLTPTYWWQDKPAVFGPSPACPKCGSLSLVPVWVDSEHNSGEAVRKLYCLECKEQAPFLAEYRSAEF